MVQVKTHKRKGRNKVSVVRRHSRKDKVSAFRGAKDFSTKQRDKLASKGDALPDGSYPIASKRDLANAISSYGRAKSPELVKHHIMKRARALGATDMLPAKWRMKDGRNR